MNSIEHVDMSCVRCTVYQTHSLTSLSVVLVHNDNNTQVKHVGTGVDMHT